MKSKINVLALFITGIIFLCSLESVRAQSASSDESVVRTTTSRTPTTSQPAVRPMTTRTTARRPTPAHPAAATSTTETQPTPARPTTVPSTPPTRRMTSSQTFPRGRGGPGGAFGGRGGSIRPYGDLLANGLVKVVCDESILKIDEQVLGAIVNSSFVLSPVVQEQLIIEVRSLGGMEEQNLFMLRIYEKLEQEDEGESGVEKEGVEKGVKGEKGEKGVKGEKGEGDDFLELPPAEMITEIANRLKDILMAEYKKQQRQYQLKLVEAQAELKPLEEKMRQLNDRERELYAKAGTSSLRRNDVLKQIQSLERRQQEMEMELVEAAAREEALQKQIAILGDQTAKKLAQDPVSVELKEIMQLREQEMKTVQKMVDTGHASQNEYFKARAAIAEARIELVKRQEAISELMGGGATMQERVKELTDITIMTAENQAVFQYVEDQLAQLKEKILELADQYEVEIALKQDSMRQSYEYSQDNIQRYRLNMQRSLLPSVSVLGGD